MSVGRTEFEARKLRSGKGQVRRESGRVSGDRVVVRKMEVRRKGQSGIGSGRVRASRREIEA